MKNKSRPLIQYVIFIIFFLNMLSTLAFFSYLDITVSGARLAPDFETVDIEGNPFQLTNVSSQVILLDFFFTECPPCKLSIPHLKELYTSYTRDKLEIVSVSPDDNATLQNFVQRPEIDMAWIVISDDDDEIWPNYLGSYPSFPHFFLVDNDSYIRYDHIGWTDESVATTLRSKIDSILSGEILNGDDNPTQNPPLPIIVIIVVVITIFIVGLFLAGQYLGWSKPTKKRHKKRTRVINQPGGWQCFVISTF